MTIRELIEEHRKEIAKSMVEAYRETLECYGALEKVIYLWNDGSVTTFNRTSGSSDFVVPRGDDEWCEAIAVVDARVNDQSGLFDLAGSEMPEDEEEAAEKEKEIIDWLVSEYNAYDVIKCSIYDRMHDYWSDPDYLGE